MTNSTVHRALNAKNINPNILKAQYAVRGEIAVRSEEYRKALQAGAGHRLPFHSVISANIGNPQQLDQKPITFFRQVLSIMEYPALIEHEEIFPEDVRERARVLLEDVGSVGAYSQSQGAYGIRKSVANFIKGAFCLARCLHHGYTKPPSLRCIAPCITPPPHSR